MKLKQLEITTLYTLAYLGGCGVPETLSNFKCELTSGTSIFMHLSLAAQKLICTEQLGTGQGSVQLCS